MDTLPSKLFPLLEEGEQELCKLGENAILLIGAARSGKSTSMHWLKGCPLIGLKEGFRTTYVNQTDGAKVSRSYLSETLLPNIEDLGDKTSLVDTAGFFENRGILEVVTVS